MPYHIRTYADDSRPRRNRTSYQQMGILKYSSITGAKNLRVSAKGAVPARPWRRNRSSIRIRRTPMRDPPPSGTREHTPRRPSSLAIQISAPLLGFVKSDRPLYDMSARPTSKATAPLSRLGGLPHATNKSTGQWANPLRKYPRRNGALSNATGYLRRVINQGSPVSSGFAPLSGFPG